MNKSFIISIILLLVILNYIISTRFNSLENHHSISFIKPIFCISILSSIVILVVCMVSSRFKNNVKVSKNQINQLSKSINNVNGTNISKNSSDNSINSSKPIKNNNIYINSNSICSGITSINNNSNHGYSLKLVNKFNQDIRSTLLAIPFVDEDHLDFNGCKLGKGDNGSVKKAKYLGKEVAIKTVFNLDKLFTTNEIKCHGLLAGHKNIVDLEGCYNYEMIKMPSLVLELMDMSLYDYLLANKCSLSSNRRSIYRIIYEVVDGLKYMHHNDFVHCDLHPGNILVKYNSTEFCPTLVKISDFGLCRYIPSDLIAYSGSIGCKYYMSPESIKGGRAAYKKSDDIYSLGVLVLLLFNMVSYGKNCDSIIQRFTILGVSALEMNAVPELESLLKRCIGPGFMRPSIEEFENEIKRAGSYCNGRLAK